MRKRKVSVHSPAGRAPADDEFSTFVVEQAADDRILKSSLWIAVGFHAVLLMVNLPALGDRALATEETEKKVFVVKPVRFQPPPIDPVRLPQQKIKQVPVPDLTPDGPEPIRLDDPRPEMDLPMPDVDAFPIPDAPPAPPEPEGPIEVGGEVEKPERIHSPQPRYTEIARKARIQGTVIVQAIIDRQGDVTHVKVIKGLPMGLSEEAVKAVRQWKFQPATLRGKPVDVYYNLTVRFQLN